VKQICKATAQIRTDVRVHVLNAGLLARSQFVSGRPCDRPTRSRFSVAFLGRRANAEFVLKFHVPLLASATSRKVAGSSPVEVNFFN
jgi:hypothetical protein